jgi:hypothetical protein
VKRSVGATLRAVSSAERGFQQASGVTLAKFCHCNNSAGNDLAHRLGLIDIAQLFESGFESVAHRRNCLWVERSRFDKRTNWHCLPPTPK